MISDSNLAELTEFLQKALENRLADPREALTEQHLKEIALRAGLTEEDWAKVSKRLEDHLQKGRNFLAFGNHVDAAAELDQAAALAPYRADVLADCGRAHLGLWKEAGKRASRDRAEEMFRKCLEIEPGHVDAAGHLSTLRKPAKKTVPGKKTILAALVALALAVPAWMALPESFREAGRSSDEGPARSTSLTSPGEAESTETRPALDGFLGIPWGASADEARAMLASRTSARFNSAESTPKRLAFDGGTFAGHVVNRFTLNFGDGGFYSAQVQLKGGSEDHRREFLDFKEGFTGTYGPPERNEVDTDVLESTWYFPVPGRPANLINLVGDGRRTGLTILYHSGGTRSEGSERPAIPGGANGDL